MAVSFGSAGRGAFWGTVAFSLATEFVVLLLIYHNASGGNGYAWVWALASVAGLQMFLALYALLSFGRRALWYHLFERDARSQAIAEEFNRMNFPRPDGHYTDADEYLREVALSPATSPEGASFAGSLLGALEAHRRSGPRSEAFFLNLAIERAIKTMTPWQMATEYHSLQ